MNKCTNEDIGRMVHAYELGLLSSDECDAVEIHLMECEHCHQKFMEMTDVTNAIRKDPGIRVTLENLSAGATDGNENKQKPTAPVRVERPSATWKIWATAAAVLVLLLLRPWNISFDPDDAARASANLIAVMPFEIEDPDADTSGLADVVTDLLITDLGESKFLAVVPGAHVLNTMEYLRSTGIEQDSAAAERTAFDQYGTEWVLRGSVLQASPHFVIAVQIQDLSSDKVLSSLREAGDSGENVFAVVDRLAARIRQELLTPVQARAEYDPDLAEVTTQSADAYRWYLEGVELYGLKHFEEAENCYHRAVRADSTFAMGWYCLAFHGVPNAVENAVKYAGRASYKEQLYIYSLEARRKGDQERSESLLLELVDRYPNEKIAWMELAWMARTNLRYEEAIDYLKQSLKADPLYIDALDLLAYAYRDAGRIELALKSIDEAIALKPNEPNEWDSKGEILASIGRPEEAVECYRKTIEIDPEFGGYVPSMRLGQLHILLEQYDDARSVIQKAITGGNAAVRSQARAMLSLIPLHQGRLSEAVSSLEDAFAADRIDGTSEASPSSAALKYHVRNRIQLARGDLQGAASSIDSAMQLGRKAGFDHYGRYAAHYAYVLALQGDTSGAERILNELRREVADKNESLDPIHRTAGFVSFLNGKYSESVSLLQKIADPSWAGFDTKLTLARAHIGVEHYSDAIDILSEALSDYVNPARLWNGLWASDAYFYLARAEESIGNRKAATEHYAKYLAIRENADFTPDMVLEAGARLDSLTSVL